MSNADSSHSSRGFHGPKCWVLSLLFGAVFGYIMSVAVPLPPAASHHQEHAAAVVIQNQADSSRVVLRADQSTAELPKDFDANKPADVDAAIALARAPVSAPADVSSDHEPVGKGDDHGHSSHPPIPLALCIPFAALLLSIALMPFINERFWHHHYPDFAFFLGTSVLVYVLRSLGDHGMHMVTHAGLEYYSFIALVGGLYVVSGGILVDIRDRGRPVSNGLLLAVGAVLANIVGTTGASVLLIRPFLRMNRGRLRPMHVVFFIFIVSNCAGCLTPIGDPPLYLGYLKGVPFFWTLSHLWPMWLFTNGLLIAMFVVYDSRVPAAIDPGDHHERAFDPGHRTPLVVGAPAVFFLTLLVAAVFIDPLLKANYDIGSLPIGATIQIVLAAVAYFTARPSIHHANHFTFAPVKEVGFLFFGIFLTMAPALEYLATNAATLGLESPTQFYFGTGILSGFLDNAPTYVSFLQVAFGVVHLPLNPAGILEFISSSFDVIHPATVETAAWTTHFNGQLLLEAVALGAVFFGAMTYIGNGPNFMVKSIVDAAHAHSSGLGVRMPSFFGYLGRAVLILGPVLTLTWALFIR